MTSLRSLACRLRLCLASLVPLAASAFAAQTFTVIHAFDQGTEGYRNYSPLVQDANGRLYGTNTAGGKNAQGTIFALNPDGTGHAVLHHFKSSELWGAFGGVIVGNDGRLYGTTSSSATTWGGVYAINRDGTGFTALRQFTGPDGIVSKAGLLQGSDGRLYGCNTVGGANNHGTVFAIQPDGTGFVVLHHFSSTLNGREPLGTLIQGTDGRLYGTTSEGGASNGGTVFALNANGTGFVVLRHLTPASDGSAPFAGVIQGQDGRLYGTCRNGGASFGTVFALNTDGSGFTVLRTLTNAVAGPILPEGRLTQLPDGRLVGTSARQGDNTIFAISPDGSGFGAVKVIDGDAQGYFLRAGLLLAADGRLYGTAQSGGLHQAGTLFRLNTDGTGFSVLRHSNERARGYDPYGPLVEIGGKLHGVTLSGAVDATGTSMASNSDQAYGTMFSIERNGANHSVLHNFIGTGANDLGYLPRGLTLSTDGRLYGNADSGGGPGGLFAISPTGGGFNFAYRFGAFPDNAKGPKTPLVRGSDGRLYGMKVDGRIIAINANGSGYTILRALATDGSEGATGDFGHRGIIAGSDGHLYGTTYNAGQNGGGTLFRVGIDGSGFSVLRHFTPGTDGYNSWSSLFEGSDGRLYGTNPTGGANNGGTLYAIEKSGNGFTILHAFASGSQGSRPQSSVVEGPDGRLYGVTSVGGAGAGTIYSINRDGSGFSVVRALVQATDGNDPLGNASSGAFLMRASDNVIYGVFTGGGPHLSGTLFSLVVVPKPVITSPLAAAGTYNQPFNYQIVATNAPTDYDALGLPTGLTINHPTGLISGAPTQSGSFPVDIAAINAGGPGLAVLNLTIAKATANVVLGNLTQTFTGTPRVVTVTTTPPGLTTTVTYNGSATAPTATGNYAVVATVADANYQGSASGTLSIDPPVPVDVTAQLQITRGGFRVNRAIGAYAQTVTLTNISAQPIAAPLSLVVDALSANVALLGAAGVTAVVAPLGSRYVTVDVGADAVLSPGETTTVVVNFSNPINRPVNYVTRALAGPGTR